METSAAASRAAREASLRVVLADGDGSFRAELRSLLEQRGIDVAGEAATGEEAVGLARELAPDVVVLDLSLAGMGGIEATRRIAGLPRPTSVLVLTVSDHDADVLDAVVAGASGYLLKDASAEEIVKGIEEAAIGHSAIAPCVASKILRQVRATTTDTRRALRIRAALSQRELQVLRLIANGKDNAEIAAELVISPKTVKNHISSILAKLQIENRIQAAVYAVRAGIA